MTSIAATLGVRLTGDESPTDSLCTALTRRHQILVLDTFEHLLDAGPNLADLVATCDRLGPIGNEPGTLAADGERAVRLPSS